MKVLLIVSLILLSVNSGLTTQISKYKRNKSKSLGIIDELNFDQFSPKEQDLIKLANFAAGFFALFVLFATENTPTFEGYHYTGSCNCCYLPYSIQSVPPVHISFQADSLLHL